MTVSPAKAAAFNRTRNSDYIDRDTAEARERETGAPFWRNPPQGYRSQDPRHSRSGRLESPRVQRGLDINK